MDDTRIRISKAQNGYIVEVTDPDIQKDNREADLVKGGKTVPWRDPDVKFTFATAKEVAEFITTNIDKMFPDNDSAAYSKAFEVASNEKAKK
jgi:hypothetical protein